MARRAISLIGRSFTQMDRAFWCLHDHPAALAVLSLPTLAGVAIIAAAIHAMVRIWDLPALYAYLIYWVACPAVVMWSFTLLPLPCAAFAWLRAQGKIPTASECFGYVLARSGRLFPVAVRLGVSYVIWFVLAGLPLLWLWPRTCLVPMVALFENQRKVFRRGRGLLKEEAALHVLALIHLCVFVGLMATVLVPRIVLATQLLATPGTQWLGQYVWVFELLCGAALVAVLAVSWCLSLTLLYHDIRYLREGESLRERIRELRESLRVASSLH
ncbi:MAG TPA: hypothetical protein EYP56_03380 [Planctomycetaceae bacterium]|nr:hypothetical protein [Planctomycetaceae bacterium]HIQ23001.1 hypothetical protein [Planctomycetota bacterium]